MSGGERRAATFLGWQDSHANYDADEDAHSLPVHAEAHPLSVPLAHAVAEPITDTQAIKEANTGADERAIDAAANAEAGSTNTSAKGWHT